MGKLQRKIFITKGVADTIELLIKKDHSNNVAITTKAIEFFLSGNQKIDEKFKISEWTHEDYVHRKEPFSFYIDEDLFRKVKEIAKANGVKYSVVIFQALYNYCLLELSKKG